MAFLGNDLVLTFCMTFIIQKLSPHFSFAEWILCSLGLKRYLHPNDNDLKIAAGILPSTKEKSKGKNYFNNNKDLKSTTFHIPKNAELHLELTNLCPADIVHLRYFQEYKWLIDFSIYTVFVYILSEVLHYYLPQRDINLSLIWCFIVILFAIKYLSSLTFLYFKSDESIGERSMCIVAFLVYLLISMVVLILDEKVLETGLEDAYNSFTKKTKILIEEYGLPATNITSKLVVKFFLAIFCGFIGSIFTFPGLRMSKMHWDSLKYCKDDRIMQLALNISFIFPLILVLLWIQPISREYLTVRNLGGMDSPLLSSHGFEVARLLMVIFVVILRFSLLRIYLQSYLNVAYDRLQIMSKEAGRITNVELKQKISSIFYYLCVVMIQFIAPLLICLYFALLYKNLTNISWLIVGNEHHDNLITNKNLTMLCESYNDKLTSANDDDENSIFKTITNFQNTFNCMKEVFSVKVYKGLLGFSLWWSCFTLFASSSFGLLYHSYFTKV